MTSYHPPNIWKCTGRAVSGLFRASTFSLLIAAFGLTTLHAQTVAYLANSGNNTVSAIDTATNKVTASIPLATSPFAVVASPDGARVYVADNTFDPNTMVASTTAIYVINTSTNTLVSTFPVPTTESFGGLAITPDGKTLYATDANSGDVHAIDAASGNFLASIPGGGTHAIVVSPDGKSAYAATLFPSQISVISTATNTVTTTISTGGNSFPGLAQMAFTPDGSFLYVPLHGPNTVAVVATATNTVVSQIPVGGSPSGVGISPNGALAYVANTGGNSVSAIEVSTNTVVATIPTSTARNFWLLLQTALLSTSQMRRAR
jgi:YVTN family beta-propeller protein